MLSIQGSTSNMVLQRKEMIVKEKFLKVLRVCLSRFINNVISLSLLPHFNVLLLHTHTLPNVHTCDLLSL